jgi:hypothetical protein
MNAEIMFLGDGLTSFFCFLMEEMTIISRS